MRAGFRLKPALLYGHDDCSPVVTAIDYSPVVTAIDYSPVVTAIVTYGDTAVVRSTRCEDSGEQRRSNGRL